MELNSVKPGSIILVERKYYDHYAIYAGNKQVVHYAQNKDWDQPNIHKANLSEFLDGVDRFYVPNIPQNKADLQALISFHKQRRNFLQEVIDDMFNFYDEVVEKVYTASETLQRAIGRIGEPFYDIFNNNCEHFAFWCKFKVRISSQIGRIYNFFNDLVIRQICQRYHNCVIC